MSGVLSFVSNLKLSLGQWLAALAALLIGVLVVALRLQGSKLHAAQVALLEAQFGNAVKAQDTRVLRAKGKFEAAKKAFEGNK